MEEACEHLAVCSFGGTIAMAGEGADGGAVPELTANDLVQALPQLARFGSIIAHSVVEVGSPSVSFANALAGLRWCIEQVERGVQGIVVTHGTDTLEETAYFMSLLWPFDVPLVFTGAMRSPTAPGADGPANLFDACVVADSQVARGLGVLIVMNGQVDYAERAMKMDTFATDAFASPGFGPAGRVVEDEFELFNAPVEPRREPLPIPASLPSVPILQPGLGCDGSAFGDLVQGGRYQGIVIAGMGAGHVPATYLDAVDVAKARDIVLVVSSRVPAGRTGRTTYGYPGAEIDLYSRGAVLAGNLSPVKARILLSILLAQGKENAAVRRQFDAWTRPQARKDS